ncbi:hypothetical protein SAMN04487970_10749 [Paenibacillus tianmuensis]|uniref:Uncharacterized protein n=1 Tax=Paenibacillus tianmuensis TaxID=624147 RepID=A0A1G4TWU4_9BACL|nr:hypothetical protein [Paenibacillus tianmuensis]SCW85882.1 hypothetical protein SAMN04487970_10749 [Paenibacillus tianmuensis]
MEEPKIRIIGGRIQQKKLTSSLDERVFAAGKAHIWLSMLKDKMVPVRWYKPNKNGTKIKFIYPQTQKEWDDSFSELKAFIATTNEKHGMDMRIE